MSSELAVDCLPDAGTEAAKDGRPGLLRGTRYETTSTHLFYWEQYSPHNEYNEYEE